MFCKNRYHELKISASNNFDTNIQFMFEEENHETIQFLDILISCKRNDIGTTVYRKLMCNDIYLNWNASAPVTWKIKFLNTLVERYYKICSTGQLLETELK